MSIRSMTSKAVCAACLALAIAACSDANAAKQQALENGNKLLKEGKTADAIVEYRNALRRDPRFGQARWQLAEALAKQQNTAAAFREYIRAADLLPDDVKAQVTAATYLLAARQFEDAKARAERALMKEPKNVDALIVRANAMAGLKDVAGAIRDVEEAIQTQPGEGRVYATLGALQTIDGKRADAEATFKKAIEVSPQSIESRLALANFYWSTGRRDELKQTLDDARKLDPTHANVNRMLAAFYIVTGQPELAEEPLKALIAREPRSKVALADYYLQMKQVDKATPVLRELAADKANFAAATLRLAQIERSVGRKPAAWEMIERILQKEPKNSLVLTTKATWQLADSDLAGSLKTAGAAVAADPSSARAQFALAEAQIANDQRDNAIKSLNEVVRLNPNVAPAHVLLSRLQLAAGNTDAAAQAAAAAQKTAPTQPDVQLAVARTALAKGNIRDAEAPVRALLDKYPQLAATHAANGLLLAGKKDYAGARAAFQRALDRDPNNLESINGLLLLDAQANNLQPAVTRIEERLAKTPRNPPLMMIAARTYAAARQTDKSEKVLKDLLVVDPDNFQAYSLLARIYLSQKRLDEALTQFDAAARLNPSVVGPATMSAMILQMQNKIAEAQKRYEAIVASTQRAPIAANNLAWIYAEGGTNLNVALQLAQTAKAQLPESPEASDTLGWIYYKQNLPALAVPPLEDSVKRAPTNVSYHYHLGLAYAKAGMTDKARASLEKALQINPQFDGADQARKTLADLKG